MQLASQNPLRYLLTEISHHYSLMLKSCQGTERAPCSEHELKQLRGLSGRFTSMTFQSFPDQRLTAYHSWKTRNPPRMCNCFSCRRLNGNQTGKPDSSVQSNRKLVRLQPKTWFSCLLPFRFAPAQSQFETAAQWAVRDNGLLKGSILTPCCWETAVAAISTLNTVGRVQSSEKEN